MEPRQSVPSTTVVLQTRHLMNLFAKDISQMKAWRQGYNRTMYHGTVALQPYVLVTKYSSMQYRYFDLCSSEFRNALFKTQKNN